MNESARMKNHGDKYLKEDIMKMDHFQEQINYG